MDREALLFKQINNRMHRPIGSHSGDGYILKENEDEDGMHAYEYILIFCPQRSRISLYSYTLRFFGFPDCVIMVLSMVRSFHLPVLFIQDPSYFFSHFQIISVNRELTLSDSTQQRPRQHRMASNGFKSPAPVLPAMGLHSFHNDSCVNPSSFVFSSNYY